MGSLADGEVRTCAVHDMVNAGEGIQEMWSLAEGSLGDVG